MLLTPYICTAKHSSKAKKSAYIVMHFSNFCFDFFIFSVTTENITTFGHQTRWLRLRTYRRHSRLVVWYVLMWWRDGLLHSFFYYCYIYMRFLFLILATCTLISPPPHHFYRCCQHCEHRAHTHTLKPMCWWWWCWCYVGYRCCEM